MSEPPLKIRPFPPDGAPPPPRTSTLGATLCHVLGALTPSARKASAELELEDARERVPEATCVALRRALVTLGEESLLLAGRDRADLTLQAWKLERTVVIILAATAAARELAPLPPSTNALYRVSTPGSAPARALLGPLGGVVAQTHNARLQRAVLTIPLDRLNAHEK